MSNRSWTVLLGVPMVAVSVGIALSGLSLTAQARSHRTPIRGSLRATSTAPAAQCNFSEDVQGADEQPPPTGAIACCLNSAEQQGCTELTPADCSAAGGTDGGTGTCDPDPCQAQGGLDQPGDNLQGELRVTAQQLTPKTRFSIVVGGVKIGTLATLRRGSGRARFQAPHAKGRNQKLTVDPRGKQIAVVNSNGEPVCEGQISDPTTPGGVQCCLNRHDQNGDQQGCDSLLPAECAAAGGIDMGPGSCEPDPCPNSGPND